MAVLSSTKIIMLVLIHTFRGCWMPYQPDNAPATTSKKKWRIKKCFQAGMASEACKHAHISLNLLTLTDELQICVQRLCHFTFFVWTTLDILPSTMDNMLGMVVWVCTNSSVQLPSVWVTCSTQPTRIKTRHCGIDWSTLPCLQLCHN